MADFTAGIRKAKVQEAIRSKIQLHFQGNEETTPAPWRCHCIATPDLFYKGRSQEKTLLPRLEVFLLLSPYDRARVVLTYRPMCSVAGHCAPALFLVIREGLESRERLGARGTQRLTNQLRLALEPECLENLQATAREISRDGAGTIRDTQAVCGFRCWASKHTPLFHTINTMVAIFLARVRRAISGRRPLANNFA